MATTLANARTAMRAQSGRESSSAEIRAAPAG
jgi:hypothetical protein